MVNVQERSPSTSSKAAEESSLRNQVWKAEVREKRGSTEPPAETKGHSLSSDTTWAACFEESSVVHNEALAKLFKGSSVYE